mmetsp:Transcript_64692/g.89519  ORF Transcript_64692/g.89519 Transcript_64692/m.89519 type:complete len:214 (+) Transcript_64692:416-1057(+)
MRLCHFFCLRTRLQTSFRASVHSTTSPTTQDVSSRLPPLPMGQSGKRPVGPCSVFLWHSSTTLRATCSRTAGSVGTNLLLCNGGNISLQIPTTSSRNKLSKTPSLPLITMSPSYTDTQCTALPRSMTSMAMRSSKSGSTRSSRRATCSGHCAFPSMRCISVWNTISKLPSRPCSWRRMSSSQSPTESTAIIGCSLPWIRVLLSRIARQIVVEP